MIAIDVTTDTLSAALARIGAAYADLTPLFRDFGEFLIQSTAENFLAGTGPDGTPWVPRSQTTLDAYAASDPPKVPVGGPLRLTGSMSSQISYQADADHVDWGSNAIQAAVMQLGAAQGQFGARIGRNKKGRDYFMTIPWGDIPARPFLGIGPEDETGLLEIITEYLEAAARD